MTVASFSVCALVRETPDVLERFCRHHLQLGARSVRIFFDGTEDEAVVPDLPGIERTVCDRDFWEGHLGRQPSNLSEAIGTAFRVAHETATSDWQFFCDADEFLVARRPLAALLASLPADIETIRVPNVEAVWGPGDDRGLAFGCTYFRSPLSRRKTKIHRLLTPRRQHKMFSLGLAGHHAGKHFLRRGALVDKITSHVSSRGGRRIGRWAEEHGIPMEDLYIAHFDAISEVRWTEKWRRRISEERASSMKHGDMHPERQLQQDTIAERARTGSLSGVFSELYTVSAYEVAVLRMLGGVRRERLFGDLEGRDA